MQDDPLPDAPRSSAPHSAPASLDVVLLYNATHAIQRGNPSDALPDSDESGIEPYLTALRQLGHEARAIGIHYANLDLLETLNADLVVNMCEGTGLDGHPGLEVAAALERRQIPFTGAGSHFYGLSSGKWCTKQRLAEARVPAPLGVILPAADAPIHAALRYPLFVKPRDAFGSLGIDGGSLVHNEAELRARVAYVIDTFASEALVEEYIDGREIVVGIIGQGDDVIVMPPLEVRFGKAYDDQPKIRSFATKHDTSSALYNQFETLCPAPLDAEVDCRVRRVALAAYKALGGDGYGRVDLRLTAGGAPFVLEVNANCSLETGERPQDCGLFVLIAQAMGWDLGAMLTALIDAAFARARRGLLARAPMALRWFENRTTAHALFEHAPGERLMAFGDTFRAPREAASVGNFVSEDGQRLLVEPHARHLDHAAEPNLMAVREGGALWLQVVRPISAGDVLSIDRRQPLPLPMLVTRARPRGRRA